MIRGLGCLLLVSILVPSPCAATIVNTLRGFENSEPGWSGSVGGAFSLTGGNTDVRTFGANGRVQWQGQQHRVRLLGAGKKTKAGSGKIEESEMAHLRHNRELAPWVSSLGFVQWQRNPFQRLRSRFLVGAGLRFDVARTEASEVAIGAAHMVEIERIEDVDGRETDQRLSAFAALHHRLRDGVVFDATAFGQPAWTDWNDLRATAQGSLRVELGANLELSVSGQWQYDARPPAGVDRADWTFETGLAYEL